ncbi:MAG: translation initiation factor IF-2 subunit gamma [Candidatus Nitrosocaldus sp.]|nr:translation initiation factor IF-2 subunit gamma [Candidatus Nitrosocaldus sp.]
MNWRDTLPEWYVSKYGYQPCLNIGTAGHVDHGKTTLVEAITGVWTSAHSEELKRGITIKVGYADAAFYRCRACDEPECFSTSPSCSRCNNACELSRVVSFVDSPGHESLMANMLSGAALMDGAMLVIAANEPVPKPQTREHMMALKILGIRNMVVVQNKVDLVSYEEAKANYESIKGFMAEYMDEGGRSIPVIPVSAQQRVNIDALIQAIEASIPTPSRNPSLEPIMHVIRSFDVNRPGTRISELKGGVLGGSLLQGELRVGDEIEVRPGLYNEKRAVYEPIVTKVVSLATGAGLVEFVRPGGLVAIGTLLDPAYTKSDSLVGSIVGRPGRLPDELDELTIESDLFDTAVGTQELIKVEPVRVNESLRLNIGTAAVLATVRSVHDGRFTVRLKRPVCAIAKSRVAISRRIADRWRLIGAGIIL